MANVPSSVPSRLTGVLCAFVGVALIVAAALVELDPQRQAALAVATLAIFYVVNRWSSRTASVFLALLSVAVSARYLFWRATETLEFASASDALLGYGLALAELHACLVLTLGYVQTLRPLGRKPHPLPDDPLTWPTVDVFIPVRREPMSEVRATALGAMAIDWPPGKLRVHLLDDGQQPGLRAFAEASGAGYLTRLDHLHGKAGNLNEAMRQTSGDFIAVFDPGHIPTQVFLQMTMGWMVHGPRIALVQTPLHLRSPDPFQRNLPAGMRVPSERHAFYGLVQDGNDFWNASSFCGSCAVLRRGALEEIGGFAFETAAQDAHTTLKLHRRGWHSAYLRLPQAAGPAADRLSLYVTQHAGWARGMIQLLRIDNPLLGRGLTLAQRVCFLQAGAQALFAVPRIVFLTTPLAYLFLGQNVIAAPPLAIASYAIPHVLHAVATRSRLAGNDRHSFWGSIHETALALSLAPVTVTTLLFPRRARATPANQGSARRNGYFDLAAVYPNLILAFLLLLGIARGLAGMASLRPEQLPFQALLLYSVWATISLLTVMAALAMCREPRHSRSPARRPAAAPVVVHWAGGRTTPGTTGELSLEGASVIAEQPEGVSAGMSCELEFTVGGKPVLVRSQVTRWEKGVLQASFEPGTLADETAVVRAVFGRADAWTDWAAYEADCPAASLGRVLASIRTLFRRRDWASPPSPGTGDALEPHRARMLHLGPQTGAIAAVLLALVLATAVARAQPSPSRFVVRLTPPPLSRSQPMSFPDPAAPALPDAIPGAPTRRLVLSLRQVGASGPLALSGVREMQSVQFGIRADEVVTQATLRLSGATSPALIPEFSNVTVTLNEQYVGTVPVNRDRPRFEGLDMPIDPAFFQGGNRLGFRFSGRYATECNDPLSSLLWSTISDASTLALTLERLPAQRDLARLPLPFLDPLETQPLTLPFVVPPGALSETLQAAGIVASWFGQQAGLRGMSFPVSAAAPAEGNAVVFANGQDRPGNVDLPPIAGPTLAVLPNPADPSSSLLLVAGRDTGEILAAAQALTLGARALGGETARVTAPGLPLREPYDAPAWIATDRPVAFGELVGASDLQAAGFAPGALLVPFRTAPDLYTWRNRGFPMELRFRAPPGPIVDLAVSRLDVGINDRYLASLPLTNEPSRAASWFSRVFHPGAAHPSFWVDIPPTTLSGRNNLQFSFDTRPLHRGDCAAIPQDMRMAVDPDSTLDLSRAYRFAQMPNLAYFVSAGFPFTRMADLAETVVILPDRVTPVELQAFLDLMGRFGAITGTPGSKLSVMRPGGVTEVGDRDVLLVGVTSGLGGALSLLSGSPYRVDGDSVRVELGAALDGVRRWFSDPTGPDRKRAAAKLAVTVGKGAAVLIGAQSPLHAGRTVVAMLGGSPASVGVLAAVLRDPKQALLIQGDMSLAAAGVVTSYRAGDTFRLGSLPFWLYPLWLLQDSPLAVAAILTVGCGLLAVISAGMLRRRAAARGAFAPAAQTRRKERTCQ